MRTLDDRSWRLPRLEVTPDVKFSALTKNRNHDPNIFWQRLVQLLRFLVLAHVGNVDAKTPTEKRVLLNVPVSPETLRSAKIKRHHMSTKHRVFGDLQRGIVRRGPDRWQCAMLPGT